MTRYTTAWNYDFLYYHRWCYHESLDQIRQRYWSHLKAQRREAAFPAPPRSFRRVRKVRPVKPRRPGPLSIALVRFQRKRRQIVKTYLRALTS